MQTSEGTLGCGSILVQAKLGYDLRPYLRDTFEGQLPPLLQRLVDQLMGYVEFRDVDPASVEAEGGWQGTKTGSIGTWHELHPGFLGTLAELATGPSSDAFTFVDSVRS